MPSIRELKSRINSVQKTQKITQAMKMVAAAKFKRASKKITAAQAYTLTFENFLTNLYSRMEPDFLPFYFDLSTCNQTVVICITSDKGLCGGFNSTVVKTAEQFIQAEQNNTQLVLIGAKGYQYFKNKSYTIAEKHPYFMTDLSMNKIQSVLDPFIAQFNHQKIGKLVLIYNKNQIVTQQLLPIEVANETSKTIQSDFFYEPSQNTVVDSFLSDYLTYQFYKALLESNAAEERTRMIAMDRASDNAQEMIRDLTLLYNRTRQATITTELTEIVSGAEALVQ